MSVTERWGIQSLGTSHRPLALARFRTWAHGDGRRFRIVVEGSPAARMSRITERITFIPSDSEAAEVIRFVLPGFRLAEATDEQLGAILDALRDCGAPPRLNEEKLGVF